MITCIVSNFCFFVRTLLCLIFKIVVATFLLLHEPKKKKKNRPAGHDNFKNN